jgi:hypothetical protein
MRLRHAALLGKTLAKPVYAPNPKAWQALKAMSEARVILGGMFDERILKNCVGDIAGSLGLLSLPTTAS